MSIDIGVFDWNAFDKIIETFVLNPQIDRIRVGMKVPDSWARAYGPGYAVKICQYFDETSSITVPGVAVLTAEVNGASNFLDRVSVREGCTHVDLSGTRTSPWEVIVRTGMGKAKFLENTIIYGYFFRNGRRTEPPVPSPVPSSAKESRDPETPSSASTAEESKKRIFNTILNDLNQKFAVCNDLTHRENVPIASSPTTQELEKFLRDNGYHCHEEFNVGSSSGKTTLVVYL